MSLVNRLVEIFDVKQSMRVVKENLMAEHADGQVQHDLWEARKFSRSMETEKVLRED